MVLNILAQSKPIRMSGPFLKIHSAAFFINLFFLFLVNGIAYSQDTAQFCKVLSPMLNMEYKGECKKGLANGKGEARGAHRYNGNFKNGLPHGKGIYFYTDDNFYTGEFQDGIKEGKGEMHFSRKDMPDSIIKGYWSGDQYRGRTYTTYATDAVPKFDRVEISPSSQSGNRITIEISTTSNSPDGQFYLRPGPLTLLDLTSMKNNSLISLLSTYESPLKSVTVFQITEFPITLQGRLSNGKFFTLELYKSANWMFRIYVNK